MKSSVKSRYRINDKSRICQGDILRDFIYFDNIIEKENEVRFIKRTFPYIVILSQECDLESDFKNRSEASDKQDKYLHSILASPAYLSEKIRRGEHLKKLKYSMEPIRSKKWEFVRKNEIPRYHHVKPELAIQVPELVIDFKHYFTISRDYLYSNFKNHYLCSYNELFRERLSQRFADYLSRIGEPVVVSQPFQSFSIKSSRSIQSESSLTEQVAAHQSFDGVAGGCNTSERSS